MNHERCEEINFYLMKSKFILKQSCRGIFIMIIPGDEVGFVYLLRVVDRVGRFVYLLFLVPAPSIDAT